ncbi:MAG: siderophore biosynthesis protein IucC [Bdellovibrio sp. ArHS]|uniref:IucA/IucC family protein n=1 Tax=Bdellovibrio sp. ArHS TaxID=1569284 RepID=UPI0005830B3D|nr:IucA/IucC family protein [Bdellovibrio sp. ArHS]KHD89646.1 MAG: siderophore biosynthesis protein IucC [Bdellovibrio sp. ArHS]
MISLTDWNTINSRMIAKSLQELTYEQVLNPRALDKRDETTVGAYELKLSSGVHYSFTAWRGVWTDLKVQASSILRNGQRVPDAGQFFIDIQKETGMDDIILANFLEEMHNTLYADLNILQRSRHFTSHQLTSMNGEELQSFLQGHPKILLNKGRMGWSAADQELYGPEFKKPIQFIWLAVDRTLCLAGLDEDLQQEDLLKECMQNLSDFKKELAKKSVDEAKYFFLPVHPWQWERYIKIQFASFLHSGHIQCLGFWGDHYVPQISLRTFSNISRPEKLDVKLPITILNTSAIRGIPGKYMRQGPALSRALTKLCRDDEQLASVCVLEEKAGLSVTHPLYQKVSAAPYRYHEFLGVLWRQSSAFHLRHDEKAILAGSLFHVDENGQSLMGAYVQSSGLSMSEWLTCYFKNIVIPLYHLQVRYGVGLVAHGQNVVVRLKNHTPTGIFLKDFQGDLRLSQDSKVLSEFDLTRLPKHYLIHDLLTGHLVTVLRFISETLQECDMYPEDEFYALLGQCLQKYGQDNAALTNAPDFQSIDLLQEKFHRVLVNKVRFKIGYADSAERPLPILGDDLINPIARSLKKVSV